MQTLSRLLLSIDDIVDRHEKRVRRSFHFAVVLTLAVALLMNRQTEPVLLLSAGLIMLAGLAPAGIWAYRRAFGLPLVPVIAAYDVVWYAFPILSGHPKVMDYPPGAILQAALTHVLFLVGMTVVWYFLCKRRRHPPDRIFTFGATPAAVSKLLLLVLIAMTAATAYAVMQGAGLWDRWVMRHLPYALRNPLHTGFSMMGMLAVFLLMFALSARLLRTGQAAFFVFTLALFIPGLLTSLYLSPLIPITAALLGGRMLATGRLPWRLALGILVVVNLLHLGKQEMRQSYWEMLGGTERNVQPFEYPAFFSEWADAGLARLAEGEARGGVEQATPAAVLDRMSLMHMLLLAQDTAPAKVGFLEGETFRTIPGSLVPRMIWAGKPPSHAGQVAMNIHFGVQRADQTENTFIAWGTVSEGWANFGYVGVLLFGVAFGALLGGVQRFTIGAPMTSLRFVIGVVFLTLGISVTQTAAGVWISMVWQSLMVVIGGSLLFMKRRPFVPVEPEPETGGDAAPALPPAPSRA